MKQRKGDVTLRLPEPLRGLGKNAVRACAFATQAVRPLPDFLIIGTKRGGTTSMYRYLLLHPQILPLFPSAARWPMAENMKGVHYFDTGYHHSAGWYRSHFPSISARAIAERRAGSPILSGEASPYYLFNPNAPERAHQIVPAAKIIVMLRHPVDRTFSHYGEQRRNGVERLSFEEALSAEAMRLSGEEDRIRRDASYISFAHEHQSYVAQSEYLRPLRAWAERFPAPNMLILRSEDFYAAPQSCYDEVLQFLGLNSVPLRDPKRWNCSPKSDEQREVWARLASHFAPHISALEEFLGRDLGWGEP